MEGKLDLGVLTGGGSTPSTRRVEVKTNELSPVEDIALPRGTPNTGELKGLTCMITGSFKSLKGIL